MNIASFFLLFIFFLSFLSSSNTYGNLKLFWKSSIDTHLQVIFFIWFLFFVLLFREFGQKLSEASKNRGGGNWLQESPSRSINLQRFWPICFVTIPFSKLSFYLSLRYVESSSRIKKTFSENPFLLNPFLRYYIFGFILSNFVNTHINIATIFV